MDVKSTLTRWPAILKLAGVVAAVFLAVGVNVIGARHYKRWDVTTGQRYTLSPATLATLHGLADSGADGGTGTIEVWVLLGGADPLEQSVKQLLVAYQAETNKLSIHYVDPDRDAVSLVDVQQRFKIEAGRTADGRVSTDAVVVVARGDRHWFVTPSDLVDVSPGDDTRAKPREEQALTGAIRNVLGGEKSRLCFTTGHGELATEPARDGWIGDLRGILEKDNYELRVVDTTDDNDPRAHAPFEGCAVVVIARPQAPFAKDESNRLRTWLLEGGSVLAAVGPVSAPGATGMEPPGLEDALTPFGIGMDEVLVHDVDPAVSIPGSHGQGFFVIPKPHAVTQALVAETPAQHPPRIATFIARSLRHVTADGAATASDLLLTSDKAYGVTSIKGASEWADAPEPKPSDPRGPFVLAMASERPKSDKSAAHGPRAVVLGSGYALADENWKQPRPLRGDAFFVENAISWLASRPAVLDVPERPAVAAGIRITEESRSEVRNYVLLYMPLAAALLGLAVALRRRSTEGEAYRSSARASSSAPSKKADTAARKKAKRTSKGP
jgi:hypothetical protein